MAGLDETIGLYNGPRAEMEKDWIHCRALLGGTDAMRSAKTVFTPKTARERKDSTLYDERLSTSVLHDVYDKTVHRIAALPFEKPPTIVGGLPGGLARIEEDADRCGTSLSVFLSQEYQDAVDRGLGVWLVDNVPTVVDDPVLGRDGKQEVGADGVPVTERRTLTVAEAEAIDARPYFSRIEPDNIVGFEEETRHGRSVCTELRVREWAYVANTDGIGHERVERVRRYTTRTVELWQRDGNRFAMIEEPREHGFPGDVIPVVALYTRKSGFLHAKPPLLGLAHLNIKHWNQQSILDTAVRYNLNPILFGKGFSKKDTETRPNVGEGATMLSPSDKAELRYVEITGSSLAVAEKQIEKTEQRMDSGAAEPLMAGSATATGEVRAEMKDQSEAQRWIEACEWAAYEAFRIAASWYGEELPEDFNITLHRASSLMMIANPQRTISLQNDVQNNRITNETYLKERARSGEFADDFDPEEEARAVAEVDERKVQNQMNALASQIEEERKAKAAADGGAAVDDPANPDSKTPPEPAPDGGGQT